MKIIKKIMLFILLMAVCLLFVLFYAVKIEPYRLDVKEYSLGDGEGEALSIVQISDIQVSESYTVKELEKLVEKVNSLTPDFFFFTGDLYENYAEYGPKEDVISALSKIEATYGKYAIWGNRDYGGGCSRHYEDILTRAGITLLQNSGEDILLPDGSTLFLAGLDDYLLGNPDIAPVLGQWSETAGGSGNADYSILMLHEPDQADDYAAYGFNLLVAGHSHGGQVRIPFLKGFTTSMAEKYIRGFYPIGADGTTKLYVNSGIGTSHYPIRFMVVPEITVFKLKI